MTRRMMALQGPGIAMRVPSDWEVEIDDGSGQAEDASIHLRTPRVHAANFPLPQDRGDFGSGAVERMVAGDVLICLLEEDPSVIGSRLYADTGMPSLAVTDFRTDGMQRPIRGQSGAQRFFSVGGRAFALYVVLGSHMSRWQLLDEINLVLEGTTFN